jgi:prolyl oligopeptidase
MTLLRIVVSTAIAASLAGTAAAAPPAPVDPRDPADPFIWLEDVGGKRSMDWVEAHNAVTEKRLEADPRFKTFNDQALAIMGAADRIPYPDLVHGEIYNFWQDEQHLRGIWRKTSLADYRAPAPHWQTVLDIDALGKAEGKSWVYKGASCLEPEEQRCLVQLSDGGEDAVEVREFDLGTGAFVSGGFHLPHAKQDIAWEDADHLLISTEWTPGDVTTSSYSYIVKRLTRGQPLSSAVEIMRGQKSDVSTSPASLFDGQGNRLVTIVRSLDFFHQQYFVVTPGGVKPLAMPAKVSVADLINGRVIFTLNEPWAGLPTGSVAEVPLADLLAHPDHLAPRAVWQPGPREAFNGLASTKNRLLLSILDNVNGRLLALTPVAGGGWVTKPLALPEKLTLGVVSTDIHSDRAFATAEGFTTPDALYDLDTAAGTAEKIRSLPARFDATGLVVEQLEAASTDGTKIPYFLVHRKDLPLGSSTPVLLDAYGGFQVSSTPAYSGTIGKLWLERGGAYALANIRGGGEFGPAWHEAALKDKRQVAYDDFAAVAKDMIARKITSPRRLGIIGGSNGGLLMGAAMTEHPELYNAVVIQVPLLDMIRIGKIAAGTSWQGEYGDVTTDAAARAFWLKTSPYHALKSGVKYPEPFIFTTTKDDRVGPQHARKFAAKMEAMDLPFFYYENTEGGHGAGADMRQSAKSAALWFTYLTEKLMD